MTSMPLTIESAVVMFSFRFESYYLTKNSRAGRKSWLRKSNELPGMIFA